MSTTADPAPEWMARQILWLSGTVPTGRDAVAEAGAELAARLRGVTPDRARPLAQRWLAAAGRAVRPGPGSPGSPGDATALALVERALGMPTGWFAERAPDPEPQPGPDAITYRGVCRGPHPSRDALTGIVAGRHRELRRRENPGPAS